MDQRRRATFPGLHSLSAAAEVAWIPYCGVCFIFSTSLEFGPEALDNCCRFYNHTICT